MAPHLLKAFPAIPPANTHPQMITNPLRQQRALLTSHGEETSIHAAEQMTLRGRQKLILTKKKEIL